MAQGEYVTLVSPGGQRYTTDQPAEVTELVTSHGYRRVTNEPEPPAPAPPEPAADEPDDEHDSPLWTDDDD